MSLAPFVEQLVKHAVLEPESVTVTEADDRGTIVYGVTVAPNDVGRIIGKDGRVITCIRQVVSAAGAKAKLRTFVKVLTD